MDDTGEEMCGVIASASPLQLGHYGLYFELILEEACQKIKLGVGREGSLQGECRGSHSAQHFTH